MKKQTTIGRWIPLLTTALALAGFASFCHAQPVIVLSNDKSESTAFYDGGSPQNAGGTVSNWWQSTGGAYGTNGCIGYYMDGTNDYEIDPAFNVSFDTAQYYLVTVQMMVAAGSGTEGNEGSEGYGHLQLSFRNTSYSWNGVGYETIYPPGANQWVTYSYAVPSVPNMAHLQLQLQGEGSYSSPVTVYIGDVTIYPIPNPLVLSYFTNDVVSANWQNYGLSASWDPTEDAPYVNALTGAGPVNITPPGSVEFQASDPGSYQGGQLNLPFNPANFEYVGIDVYDDGNPTNSTDNGGFQIQIANGNAPYNWAFIGSASFSASTLGKWTHYTFPCASSGIVNAAGLAVQSTPGSGAGAVPITFHIDNIQVWTPIFQPTLIGPLPPTAGGVQLTLDGDSTNNVNDQEGFSSPSTNNADTDFFWINQTPATYSFTLTNFPKPASAPSFDAHIYIWNGDSETTLSGNNGYGYNETYSGVPYNVPDYLGLRVQNGTNGGVVAIVEWKTNLPNSNATNTIPFNFPSMASANGTWSLNFTDNTHGNVTAADGSVNSFTLPDFYDDPNYNANFTPLTSVVQFGVFKNGNVTNNNQTATITSVLVSNAVDGTLLQDGFNGPGLTANYNWQVSEYYLDAADRAIWQPFGTGYWLRWNTTAAGWNVQSTSNLLSGWNNGGVTYTYTDDTGSNTLGAVPITNLPAGNAGFFQLVK